MSENILNFESISKKDVGIVGGKAANLGEMIKAGFPVPPGFSVTAQAYFAFLKSEKLDKKIAEILSSLEPQDFQQLKDCSHKIKEMILSSVFPRDLKKELLAFYHRLTKRGNALVAVRSSATAEDLPTASFAGQQKTFLNVQGDKKLVEAVQNCWASLFEPRAIFYREEKGFPHLRVGIAVVVQKMVQSEVSGVMFTIDPLTNDPGKIAIEAVFGLGESIVSGALTPDQYTVDKNKNVILDKKVVLQKKMITRKGEIEVSRTWQKKQKLSDEKILQLAQFGRKVEILYDFPQDIEWGLENNTLFLLQTRPVTTITLPSATDDEVEINKEEEIEISDELPLPLLSGIGASPGTAFGPVKIIHSASEINKVKTGEVLVTEMTTPDYVPAMKKAVSIVTDKGGKTCHAAIVSRELGIPCVVGTQSATQMLKTKEVVTVDGTQGLVYPGEVILKKEREKKKISLPSTVQQTATKIFVNIATAENVEEIAKKNVDGVGLLRAEFIFAEFGFHPQAILKTKKVSKLIAHLYQNLLVVCKAFDPRPVIYRTNDFKTNEYRNLQGGEKYESKEENPMLGFRGASRYVSNPEVFSLELEAIKKVRQYHKNLWLMIPFVRTPEELIQVKKILSQNKLHRGGSFHLYLMVEVPSTVLLLEKFIGVGIDGVSIGSNDLTQLILGVDRDNEKIADLFNEENDAVLWAIERTIKTCSNHGIASSICGEAPSNSPQLAEKLVRWGINSVSVNPDVIETTRDVVAQAEYNLIMGR